MMDNQIGPNVYFDMVAYRMTIDPSRVFYAIFEWIVNRPDLHYRGQYYK